MGDVRFAADITVGVAGSKGNFAAFVWDAETPALLREGARKPSVAGWMTLVLYRR